MLCGGSLIFVDLIEACLLLPEAFVDTKIFDALSGVLHMIKSFCSEQMFTKMFC